VRCATPRADAHSLVRYGENLRHVRILSQRNNLKALEVFIEKRPECILSFSSALVSMRASCYADDVRRKGGYHALPNSVGFY
jgi:hypothetical protein